MPPKEATFSEETYVNGLPSPTRPRRHRQLEGWLAGMDSETRKAYGTTLMCGNDMSLFIRKTFIYYLYSCNVDVTVQKIMGRLCIVVEPGGFCKKVCNSLNMIVGFALCALYDVATYDNCLRPKIRKYNIKHK